MLEVTEAWSPVWLRLGRLVRLQKQKGSKLKMKILPEPNCYHGKVEEGASESVFKWPRVSELNELQVCEEGPSIQTNRDGHQTDNKKGRKQETHANPRKI